jgi:hypothetical protein
MFITVFTTARQQTLLWASWTPTLVFKINFNIIPQSTPTTNSFQVVSSLHICRLKCYHLPLMTLQKPLSSNEKNISDLWVKFCVSTKRRLFFYSTLQILLPGFYPVTLWWCSFLSLKTIWFSVFCPLDWNIVGLPRDSSFTIHLISVSKLRTNDKCVTISESGLRLT